MKLILPRSPDAHSPPQREKRNINVGNHFLAERDEGKMFRLEAGRSLYGKIIDPSG
jgi:hypothetical protein